MNEVDPLHQDALNVLRTSEEAPCIALIQRRMRLGYRRTMQIMNEMIARGEVVRLANSDGTFSYILDRG